MSVGVGHGPLGPAQRAVLELHLQEPGQDILVPQMHRLRERAIADRIPNREADPFLPTRIERHTKCLSAERREICRGNNLPADFFAIATRPDNVPRSNPV